MFRVLLCLVRVFKNRRHLGVRMEIFMRIKNGFVLKEIAGECIVVAVDSALNFDRIISLNATAKTIWLALEKGAETDELVKALTDKYEVSEDVALSAVEDFVAKLKELDFLA